MADSLYTHFPYCAHLCNYCDFYKKILPGKDEVHKLNDGIRSNFRDVKNLLEGEGKTLSQNLDTVYVGGGTPSLWGAEGGEFFKTFLEESGFSLSEEHEFTLEADPGAWTPGGLESWRRAGANRFSLGVQSYDETFLKIMDRNHGIKDVTETLKSFSNSKLNFSVDLMLGLPYSSEKKRNVIEELKRLTEFSPAHFSVYILKTRSNYPHNDYLPEEEFVCDEYMRVSDFLRSLGYLHYEVSNFAKAGKESKHNLKYWAAKDVHSLGPNATGFFKTKTGAIRYQHKPSGKGLTLEKLDAKDLLLEKVYLALRTTKGMDLTAICDQGDLQKKLVEKWRISGFLNSFSEGRVILSPQGFLMIDSIMDDLFRENLL